MTTLLASCTGSFDQNGSLYPGNPDENDAPKLVSDKEYRNLALNRKALASSAYDYNLTAHLATNGIPCTQLPAYISVSTSKGPVAKNEREWMFDMKTNTGYSFEGQNEYVRVDFINYLPEFENVSLVATISPRRPEQPYFGAPGQEAGQILSSMKMRAQKPLDINWNIALEGSEDGEAWVELDKISGKGTRINQTMKKGSVQYPHLRLVFSSENADSWSVKDWDFFKDGVSLDRSVESQVEVYRRDALVNILPSEDFKSCWMSAGEEEEWIYVDLGTVCSIKEVKTEWLSGVPQGKIQFSDNAADWRDVADIAADVKTNGKARFVRLLCTAGGPYILGNFEVWGNGGLVTEAQPQPEAKDGRLDLKRGNWKIQRASEVEGDASAVSFDDSKWIAATVPGTALVSYLNAGAIPDPDYSDYQLQVSESFFNSDFWYRDSFELPSDFEGKRLLLNFDGINWKADVYVNGKNAGRIEGAFIRGQFDVTDFVQPGTNVLAVKIIKCAHPGAIKEQTALSTDSNGGLLGGDNPTFHSTVGWDWIPTVRGRDIGIWNDVYLTAVGDVTVEDPFVRSELSDDNKLATVFVETELLNRSGNAVSGVVKGSFGSLAFEQEVSLAAGERKTVSFEPLKLENPELWWPAGYGEQHLYDVNIEFEQDGAVSDTKAFKSGVREMKYDDSDGILSVWVNGRRFVGRGGNWGFAESNLRYRAREYDAAVRYHADMHFTMIRNWVGQVGDEEFYEACDKYGVMVWQDFWLANPWDGPDPYDEDMFVKNAKDYIKRIRNHASIGVYCGRNEGMPTATLDEAFKDLTTALHPGLHYIPHSAASVVSGGGPYRALPVKNYFDLHGFDRMHSERGMPNVMNYEDLIKAIPEDQVWPQSSLWGIHDFTLESAQYGSSFNELVSNGFGEVKDAREFTELAQWINYNGYRAIFEGRSEHRRGMLLWMSHPCWPSMVWQTYDYYLDPTAAYFGCKKACEPLHIQFNALSGNVEVVNISGGDRTGLVARAEVFTMYGESASCHELNLDSNEDSTVICFPVEVPEDITDVYFIRLTLLENGSAVSENFYWEGKEDGNYQALRTVGQASVAMKSSVEQDGDVWKASVTLTNKSSVPAMMIRVKAVDKLGDVISPAIYSDNYIFLMPGDSRTIDVEVADADSFEAPRIEFSGFNL